MCKSNIEKKYLKIDKFTNENCKKEQVKANRETKKKKKKANERCQMTGIY